MDCSFIILALQDRDIPLHVAFRTHLQDENLCRANRIQC